MCPSNGQFKVKVFSLEQQDFLHLWHLPVSLTARLPVSTRPSVHLNYTSGFTSSARWNSLPPDLANSVDSFGQTVWMYDILYDLCSVGIWSDTFDISIHVNQISKLIALVWSIAVYTRTPPFKLSLVLFVSLCHGAAKCWAVFFSFLSSSFISLSSILSPMTAGVSSTLCHS